MAYKKVPKNTQLEVGDKVRSHFKIDAPDILPNPVEDIIEGTISHVTKHAQEFSDRVNNYLTGEARVEFIDAYYENKGDFYDLVFVYEVKHTSVLLVSAVTTVLTSTSFWAGIGLLYTIITFGGSIRNWFNELDKAGQTMALGVGTALAVGVGAYMLTDSGG